MIVEPDTTQKLVCVLGSGQAAGRFIRQMGSPGHYGHVVLTVEPSTNYGLSFEWAVEESVIPRMFSAAVLRGIQRTCSSEGPFRGCTFTRTKVLVIGGSFHEIDSRERSYEMASALAFADAVHSAGGVDHAA